MYIMSMLALYTIIYMPYCLTCYVCYRSDCEGFGQKIRHRLGHLPRLSLPSTCVYPCLSPIHIYVQMCVYKVAYEAVYTICLSIYIPLYFVLYYINVYIYTHILYRLRCVTMPVP